MAYVDDCYNKVRKDLADVGLLVEGFYLDHVEVCVTGRPSVGEAGYLFEEVGSWCRQGYRPGVIYLPSDLPEERSVPGGSLVDTIRHEYAHAWYFTDPKLFREEWFINTFGASYTNCNPRPRNAWRRQLSRNRAYRAANLRCRTEKGRTRLREQAFRQHFISDYASTCACEDFAETFMFFLKYRNSIQRFERRSGVFRKLCAVERAISKASRRLHMVSYDQWLVRGA